MRLLTLTIATAALIAPLASANAAPPVRAGILQCQGGQNVGFVVGSVTSLECCSAAKAAGLSPTSQGASASVSTSASPQQTWLSWAVNAPNTAVGAANSPAAMVASAPMHRSASVAAATSRWAVPPTPYALQPISLQGQTGLNVAAGNT